MVNLVKGTKLTTKDIQSVAGLVDLTLSESDSVEVAALLSDWISSAIVVSERMQCEGSVSPITPFNPGAGLDVEI